MTLDVPVNVNDTLFEDQVKLGGRVYQLTTDGGLEPLDHVHTIIECSDSVVKKGNMWTSTLLLDGDGRCVDPIVCETAWSEYYNVPDHITHIRQIGNKFILTDDGTLRILSKKVREDQRTLNNIRCVCADAYNIIVVTVSGEVVVYVLSRSLDMYTITSYLTNEETATTYNYRNPESGIPDTMHINPTHNIVHVAMFLIRTNPHFLGICVTDEGKVVLVRTSGECIEISNGWVKEIGCPSTAFDLDHFTNIIHDDNKQDVIIEMVVVDEEGKSKLMERCIKLDQDNWHVSRLKHIDNVVSASSLVEVTYPTHRIKRSVD